MTEVSFIPSRKTISQELKIDELANDLSTKTIDVIHDVVRALDLKYCGEVLKRLPDTLLIEYLYNYMNSCNLVPNIVAEPDLDEITDLNYIIDNDPATTCTSGSVGGNSEDKYPTWHGYIKFDLGSVKHVDLIGFKLEHHDNGAPRRDCRLRIEISEDGSAWEIVYDVANPGTSKVVRKEVLEINKDIRYARIHLTAYTNQPFTYVWHYLDAVYYFMFVARW